MMGQLMVNLPVVIVLLLIIAICLYIGLGLIISVFPTTLAGWFLWSRQLDQWKKWAFAQGVSRERLFILGKYGFINYYRYRIFDEDEVKS